jgi:hypothetical protein
MLIRVAMRPLRPQPTARRERPPLHCRGFAPCLAANWTVFQSVLSLLQLTRTIASATSESADELTTQDTSKHSQHSADACRVGLCVSGIGREFHLADLVAMHLVGPVGQP